MPFFKISKAPVVYIVLGFYNCNFMLTGYMVQINVLGLWHTDEYDGKDEKENGGETPEAAVEAKEVLQVGEDLQHGEGEDCGDRPDETFASSTRVVWEKFRGEKIRNCLDAQLKTEHLKRKKHCQRHYGPRR